MLQIKGKFRLIYSAVIIFLAGGYIHAQEHPQQKKSLSAFPIFMYDSDIGFGYGGKVKLVDYLARQESLDLILFNSSKGERWYVLTFSIPDFEIRQGEKYGLSLDIKAEYDKYLKYYFYGYGADSLKENESTFTYEKKELQLTLGRGFTDHVVVEASYFFRSVRYFNVSENQTFTEILQNVGDRFSPYVSLLLRYDTSDSRIHPRHGFSLWWQNDLAGTWLGNQEANFNRMTLDFRKYFLLFGQHDVVAVRGLIQKISGSAIPQFEMPVLGGGSTLTALRGYRMNRFIDKGKWLLNVEYRFPIWKKLGGNIFFEAGSVWPSLAELFSHPVHADVGWGLRYYLQDFLVRFDMGISREGVGIYFNFGHIF